LTLLLSPPGVPAALDTPAKVLRDQAERLEKLGDWGAAAEKYDELLRLDRNQPEVRKRFQHCLQRYFQVVRLRDPSYRKDVLSVKYSQAMRLYEIVLFNLLNNTLDKDRVSPSLLFQKGLQEFHYALENPDFCLDHLKGLRPAQTEKFRKVLQEEFGKRKIRTYEEAADALRDVVSKSANYYADLNATTVVMEFLCGACLAMDDYTLYLTPRQLRELYDTLKGRHVGVGLRLKNVDNKVLIAEVLPDSPAGDVVPKLAVDDHVVRIGNESTLGMSLEVAQDLLEGEEGTDVELVVASPTEGHRIITLRRRALVVPSVHHEMKDDGVIGYLKIHCFQETTLQEFDDHMAELLKKGCKSLILDLRGNPGGLLNVAVEIARRFLPEGIVVSSQEYNPKSKAIEIKVERSSNTMALTIPLVVLVDADTASAAEVLAGALKENGRALVVGQTTYGKGCSQGLMKLPSESELRAKTFSAFSGATGGIRITIARFFSPKGNAYSGRGVEPDLPAEAEFQLDQAKRLAAEQMH
jgi:carboxyl-terminal processing protease